MAKPVKAPPSLKAVQHYVNVAVEHDQRDPVIAYYCRLYSVQKGMALDKQSPEAKQFLFSMMDVLETLKKANSGREELTNDLVGQTYVEQHALRLFSFADKQDRGGNFDKATVKAFYTAGLLLDVAGNLNELSEDAEKCRKYAKWKAVYITSCQKRGEVPVAGPLPSDEEGGVEPPLDFTGFDSGQPQPAASAAAFPPAQRPGSSSAQPASSLSNNVSFMSIGAQPAAAAAVSIDFTKAEQVTKLGMSAMQFEDAPTAIDYLQKAIAILQGKPVK